MSREKQPTPEQMQKSRELYDSFSDDFLDAMAEKAFDAVNTGLMAWGDVDSYRDLQRLVRIVSSSLVLWAVEEGYVSTRKKALAGADELSQRKSEVTEQEKRDHLERLFGNAGGTTKQPSIGAYI